MIVLAGLNILTINLQKAFSYQNPLRTQVKFMFQCFSKENGLKIQKDKKIVTNNFKISRSIRKHDREGERHVEHTI